MRGGASLLFHVSLSVLLAQEADPNRFGMLMPIITLAMIMFLYMFVVQRPAMKREQQARDDMLSNLKKNDRVLTTGGIYGVVTNVQLDADEVTIRVDETTNTKIKVTRTAIHRVLSGDGKDKDKDAA